MWHALYRDNDPEHANDVGLLVLDGNATEGTVEVDSDPANHAALAKALNGNFATVALGWGVDDSGTLQSRLQLAVLPLAQQSLCTATFGSVSNDTLCAGGGRAAPQAPPASFLR